MILQQAAGVLMLLLATATQAPPPTGAPVQELRNRVDRAVQTLTDPSLKVPSKVAERRARVRRIADELFDFGEMSKRAMGVHWQQLQGGDRERFVRTFADLLDCAYF